MKNIKYIIAAFALLLVQQTTLTSQEKTQKEPWETIFNGTNLKGWSIIGSNGSVVISDSAIVCHMVSNTPEHTFVRSNKKYGDFILEADCKLDSGEFHTGFLLRCIDAPDTASVCLYGYQVKIDPTVRKWTGGVFDDFGSTWKWMYNLADDARARDAFKLGYWNHFRIECIGNNIRVWINGTPTCNLVDQKYTKGYIALKIHSLKNFPEKEKYIARYKNIRIISKSPATFVKTMPLAQKTSLN